MFMLFCWCSHSDVFGTYSLLRNDVTHISILVHTVQIWNATYFRRYIIKAEMGLKFILFRSIFRSISSFNMAAGPFNYDPSDDECFYLSITEDFHFLDSHLAPCMFNLKNCLLTALRKFRWDFKNIWSARYHLIESEIRIQMKICLNHGISVKINVFPKSLDASEQGSLWLERFINFQRRQFLVEISVKQMEMICEEILETCQEILMLPGRK